MNFNREKEVTVRKPHICFGHGGKIEIGQKAIYSSGTYYGDFYSLYTCLTCAQIMELIHKPGDEYREGFVNEMKDSSDQTPEQILELLKARKK